MCFFDHLASASEVVNCSRVPTSVAEAEAGGPQGPQNVGDTKGLIRVYIYISYNMSIYIYTHIHIVGIFVFSEHVGNIFWKYVWDICFGNMLGLSWGYD